MEQAWIESRLKELKKTKSGLADALDIAPARITEMIKGTRRVQGAEMTPMSNYLEMDAADLLRRLSGDSTFPSPAKLPQSPLIVTFVGAAEAGPFVPEGFFEPEDRILPFASVPERYQGMPLYAVTVRGTSMNLSALPGSTAIFVDALDYIKGLPEDVTNAAFDGKMVVVEHNNGLGQYEQTVKRYRHQADNVGVLEMESSDPKYAGQTVKTPLNGNDEQEYRIKGVVVAVYREDP